MSLGIHGRLFVISLALIIIVGLVGGGYLEAKLRDAMTEHTRSELAHLASAARRAIEAQPPSSELGEVANWLNRNEEQWIVITDKASGRVLSPFSPGGSAAEEHRWILTAVNDADAMSVRPGDGTGPAIMYVAVPYSVDSRSGVVGAARSLREIDDTVAWLHSLLLIAGAIGLVVAVFMSLLSTLFMSRTLRRISDSARAFTSNPSTETVISRIDQDHGSEEIRGLAGSLSRMAGRIKATLAATAAERARFEAVLEGMNEAVIALDSEHSITLMNRTALEFLGRAEAALGEPFIHHLRVPAIHNALRGCTEPITCEFDLPGTSDGSAARRIMARVSPEPLSGGYILVMHDVTSVRRLETVRRDFVANVSHELRTPVSIIRANAETLLDGAMSDPVHGARLMDGLQRNAERLSRLLEDLLDLARLEAERYTTQIEEVEVATAVVRAIDSIERAAHSKQIELQVAVDSDLRMRVDDKALDQILVNYLDNAVKYTPDGGRVVVSARASDDHRGPVITVEVADNGPGIAAHHRERVFERFYRVDPGRSRDMGGTGLGLSIVKHLAEAMDGEAGVEANEPQGSRFWIRLPRA